MDSAATATPRGRSSVRPIIVALVAMLLALGVPLGFASAAQAKPVSPETATTDPEPGSDSPEDTDPPETEPTPKFKDKYLDTCEGVTAKLKNGKTRAAYALLYRIGSGPIQSQGEPAMLEAGESVVREVPGTPGTSLSVSWQPVASEINGKFYKWKPPVKCDKPESSFTATYKNTCTGMTTTITNGDIRETYALLRVQSGIDGVSAVPGQENIKLKPHESHTATVPAVEGRGFSLSWQKNEVHDIEDTFVTWQKPASCTPPSSTPPPSNGGGGGSTEDSGDSDSLPVTGARTNLVVGVGAVLLIGGLLAVTMTRRRQRKFIV